MTLTTDRYRRYIPLAALNLILHACLSLLHEKLNWLDLETFDLVSSSISARVVLSERIWLAYIRQNQLNWMHR